MPSDPIILAFDTSAAHCAAALLCGNRILGTKHEELARGQAERLFPLLEELLQEHSVSWSDLTRIGVGIGPGNFTGIRISVAAARGLAVSLGIDAIGVSSLEVQYADCPVVATVPAPREQCYFQALGTDAPPAKLGTLPEANALARELGAEVSSSLPAAALTEAIARLAKACNDPTSPAPLYIRGADAAPPKDPAPVILP